jgi:hypothetical protein
LILFAFESVRNICTEFCETPYYTIYTIPRFTANSFPDFIFNLCGCSGSQSTVTAAIGLMYQRLMIDSDDCGAVGGMNEWQGKPEYWEETCPCAALSTTDPT